jgi:drug/metabolite transporter (DMT)-like permease
VKPNGSYVIYDNVFDPIYRIVSARKAGVMATLIDLPWWVVVVVGVLVANIAERMSPKNSTQIGLLVVLAVSSIGFLPLFRHTVVELRYSYERTPKWRNVKEWLAKGLWIIIGVILAGLGQIIWSYMKKHLGQ